MTTTDNQALEREDIEALLPWHAAGTLSRRDAQRVEVALSCDDELARQYELVREELAATIHLNETLGAPSARVVERLFAQIDAEATSSRKRPFNLATWIAGQLSQLSPRTLAWSATAATLAIALQAGLLAGLYFNDRGDIGGDEKKYDTASTTEQVVSPEGSYVLADFAPDASVAEITRFLETNKFAVVDGPRAGIHYKLRVSPTGLPKADLVRIAKRIQDDNKIFRFVVPTE